MDFWDRRPLVTTIDCTLTNVDWTLTNVDCMYTVMFAMGEENGEDNLTTDNIQEYIVCFTVRTAALMPGWGGGGDPNDVSLSL
jgi:hypothetical protein